MHFAYWWFKTRTGANLGLILLEPAVISIRIDRLDLPSLVELKEVPGLFVEVIMRTFSHVILGMQSQG